MSKKPSAISMLPKMSRIMSLDKGDRMRIHKRKGTHDEYIEKTLMPKLSELTAPRQFIELEDTAVNLAVKVREKLKGTCYSCCYTASNRLLTIWREE